MTGEVRLRTVEEADLELFYEYEQDPEATRRSRFPARERERFMTHWKTRILANPTGRARTVLVEGEVAGSFLAWWDEERRFIGYWLGRAYWGRGVGTAALGLFLQEETVRPLYADPHAGNTASVRLLERYGFRRVLPDADDEFVLLRLEG